MALVIQKRKSGRIHAIASGYIADDVISGRSVRGYIYTRIYLRYDSWKDEEGKPVREYINVVAFGPIGRFARNLERGDCILVTGRLSPREYTDRFGVTQKRQEIICDALMVQQYRFSPQVAKAKSVYDDADDDAQDADDEADRELEMIVQKRNGKTGKKQAAAKPVAKAQPADEQPAVKEPVAAEKPKELPPKRGYYDFD